jgi:hypothetical protein
VNVVVPLNEPVLLYVTVEPLTVTVADGAELLTV